VQAGLSASPSPNSVSLLRILPRYYRFVADKYTDNRKEIGPLADLREGRLVTPKADMGLGWGWRVDVLLARPALS
jgi:hypothetical protein